MLAGFRLYTSAPPAKEARCPIQVLAVRDTQTEEVHANPGAGTVVKPTDLLLVLGRDEDLARLKEA